MSTRTTGKRSTIAERCFTRRNRAERKGKDDPSLVKHIRAELQRVARQVRKKKVKSATKYSEEWYYNAGIDDAIELLKEAGR